MSNQPLACATAPRRNSKTWKAGTVTWEEFCGWVASPADKKECGNYLFGTLSGPTRSNRTIVTRSAVTLDADYSPRGLPAAVEALGVAAAVHTTFTSAPDGLRYRVVVPLEREVTPEEYHAVAEVLMERLGRHWFDPGSSQPARYMFRPATQNPAWYESYVYEGQWAEPETFLAEFTPEMAAALPAPRVSAGKRDPLALPGAAGAFNRVYTIAQAIEAYDLPYEAEGADRWHLVGASSAAGMGLISDSLAYSHHVKDPAYGQAVSAFDLVRLHRFGDLDEDAKENTPVNRLPSTEAMLALAGEDPKVTAEMVGADFTSVADAADLLGGEFADDMRKIDWRLRLQLHPRTGKVLDRIDNWDLIAENDPAFTGLRFNEMALTVETETDLPWREVEPAGVTFSGIDRAALAHHLEREYGVRPARYLVDELVYTTAQRRWYHPVRDYLETLEWDGVKRLETALPGVRPTEYTRMVARKVLTAAVARAMEPGVKWDHTLVLYGSEGLGKSWWVEKMSRGFAAPLGPLANKDTLLVMQRSWIMLADEAHSLRKADADAQKEFLTRTEDVFRLPYDREALPHKRHSVIWSTTNDEVFLRRQEGNRRFLIVRCEDKVDFAALTDDYIDQVWAEALTLYRAGEPLFLEDMDATMAADVREEFTEEDALAGVVEGYLDTPVPVDWPSMTPESRVAYLTNLAEGFTSPGPARISTVCSMQVWVEALGRRVGDHRRIDLLEINAVLKRLPGWVAVPGRTRLPGYGPQQVYVRASEFEDLL